ncbi:hypothetical protein [Streptomyces dysideae]|uniref:Uncharacterized protein n=1 Tax=Streptomyces dysideae TaxID=909626 RepID=A0A101UIU6_9ACTN|nr:hypothetical protein [Streptomyces dysideae]KUO11484.1 hypothetical protein AQJ91_48100 [Streptomyces dysideae]
MPALRPLPRPPRQRRNCGRRSTAWLGQIAKHRLSGGEGQDAFEEVILSARDTDEPSLLLIQYIHRDAQEPGEIVLGFAVDDVDEVVTAVREAGEAVRSTPWPPTASSGSTPHSPPRQLVTTATPRAHSDSPTRRRFRCRHHARRTHWAR